VTFASQGLTLLMPLPVTLALSASVGLVAGIASIYVSGAILYWSGRLLGGHANAVDIRCALAWSQLPIICGLTIWIPLVIYSSLIGLETIISQEFNTSYLLQAGFVMLASYCALGIWSFILFLQSYSEVQHLNLLRALGSILLPVVVFYLVAIVVSLI
jgi:hypothetical protein